MMVRINVIITSILCISGSLVFGGEKWCFTKEQLVPLEPFHSYAVRRIVEFNRVEYINETERGMHYKCTNSLDHSGKLSRAYQVHRNRCVIAKEQDIGQFKRNREDESDSD